MSTHLRVHFIAIGGAAMHNIALDLYAQGYIVTGSDDEIYEPSRTRLAEVGILPVEMGWYEDRIHAGLDMVILGMHARIDNPELLRAQELGLKIYSYPEFVYSKSMDKVRIIIAGSHGKTTTTAMILHVLKTMDVRFDYLVGAKLDGFDRMVSLTDAPIIVIEGDEYLSSPIDRIPKILHYHPHIAVITGIAWDHVNVFPTFDIYKEQFAKFIATIEDQPSGEQGRLVYYGQDSHLADIVSDSTFSDKAISYNGLVRHGVAQVEYEGLYYPISVIGQHNLLNMEAALQVCQSIGIAAMDFFDAIANFTGAAKRLQLLSEDKDRKVFLDFAHAPSKVTATTTALKDWYGDHKLLAVLELHTFSSLQDSFLPQYAQSLNGADQAVVFYNEHTLKAKNMPSLDNEQVVRYFDHPRLRIFTDSAELHDFISRDIFSEHHILLMTSGTFAGMKFDF